MKVLVVLAMVVPLNGADIKPVTGQDYRSWTEEMRTFFAGGYYMGYVKGHIHGKVQVTNQTIKELIAQGFKPLDTAPGVPPKPDVPPLDDFERCLYSLTIGQAGAIVDKYLADHPERWDKQIGDLAEEAFTDACAKRAKNP